MVLSTETSSTALPRFVTLTNARFVMGPMSTDKSGSRRAGIRALQTGISGLTTMNLTDGTRYQVSSGGLSIIPPTGQVHTETAVESAP